MKKILFLCLVFSMIIVFSGCGCNHEWVETSKTASTCTTDGNVVYSCEKCDAVLEEVIFAGHDWIESSCIKPKHCTKCGETDGAVIGHTVKKGVCDRCGEQIEYTLTDLAADLIQFCPGLQIVPKSEEVVGAVEGYEYIMSDGSMEIYCFDKNSEAYKTAEETQELYLASTNSTSKAIVKNGYAYFISSGTCSNAMVFINIIIS